MRRRQRQERRRLRVHPWLVRAAPERTVLWTAPAAGTYVFDLSNSLFDTVPHSHYFDDACEGTFPECGDDGGTPTRSLIEAEMRVGEPILLSSMVSSPSPGPTRWTSIWRLRRARSWSARLSAGSSVANLIARDQHSVRVILPLCAMRVTFAAIVLFLLCAMACGEGAPADPAGEATVCGDGVRALTEACDSGGMNSDTLPGACRTDCMPSRCGDGVVDPGEACDGGADCTAECTSTATCGDQIVDEGEDCDDGGPGCSEFCTSVTDCGDGTLEFGEECDDGNLVDGDGCSSSCTDEAPTCGDGVVSGREECDDGNLDPTDACTDRCRVARCGDSRVLAGVEECDDGQANGRDRYECNNECQVPRCGDGIVDPEELCDDGAPSTPECQLCGLAASEASVVNLVVDGPNVSLYQDTASGPVIGAVPPLSATLGRPVMSGLQEVDLVLSDGTVIAGVETEHGMGPGDNYTFVVYGTAEEPSVRVVREVNSPPPDGEVRLRVLNALADQEFPVSLQESSEEPSSEFLLFVSLFGEMTLDVTRPAGELDVVLLIHADEQEEFEFGLGRTEVGIDSSIFISGTSDAPVIVRTSTGGEVTIAAGRRLDPRE